MGDIKELQKPPHLHSVGENVLARCPGYSGIQWGTIEDINEEEPQDHSLPSCAPKESMKAFPKWIPRNTSKQYFRDHTLCTEPTRNTDTTDQHLAAEPPFQSDDTEDEDSEPHWEAYSPNQPTVCLGRPTSSFQVPVVQGAVKDREESPRQRRNIDVKSRDSMVVPMNMKEELRVDQRDKHIYIPRPIMTRDEKIHRLEKMVSNLQQEVLCLKRKVRRLEAAPLLEVSDPLQRPAAELFNGHTREQLRETIRFDQKISTACKTLLHKLFSSDYIQSHSITGRRGNTFRQAKPMMDDRCIKIIRVLLKQRFGGHLSDTVITEKIQNVQKALRQKFKSDST
ncbi:uncharacterized protein [Ambystoma mexicanum]|uniref:uncharacterized protein n=1 Tax=Ambystoma mexicanum TaxID=8296 RepID=UPI0037E88B79